MSVHHEEIDWYSRILVWLPVPFLIFSGRFISVAGGNEFLIACAGWSNFIAVVHISRELQKDDGIGLLRAICFFVEGILFIAIFAWDFVKVFHLKETVYIITAFFALLICAVAVFSKRANGKVTTWLFFFISLSIIITLFALFCFMIPKLSIHLLNFAQNYQATSKFWFTQKAIIRYHSWTHLLGIPAIYLVFDALQRWSAKTQADQNRFGSYSRYDSIMCLVGVAFAFVCWHIAPPLPSQDRPIDYVLFENIAAASILVLWNIAYVHFYPHYPRIDKTDRLEMAVKKLAKKRKFILKKDGS